VERYFSPRVAREALEAMLEEAARRAARTARTG
jgi:hypothetical protein